MNSLKRVALSGARWTLAARVGLQLVTWPITIVVMRLLEPGDYGLFAIAMLVQGFIALFAELGLGVALVQMPQVSRAQLRMTATLVLALNATLALALVLLAPWVALEYDQPELTGVMWALTTLLALASLSAVPLAILERDLRFRAISLAQVAGGVSAAIATLLVALADAGVWALVAGALTNAAVRTVGLLLAHGKFVRPGPVHLHAIRPLVNVSSHTLLGRILWFWSGQADNLLLGLQLQASALGAYNVSSQLAMLPAGKAMEAVNQVGFPLLCRLGRDVPAQQTTARRVRALLALYGFGICWGLAAVAPEFVLILLGEKWQAAQWPLTALALVAPLRMLTAFNNTVVTAAGEPLAATRELVLASALIPGSVALGGWFAGLTGAAAAWLLAYPIVFAASTGLTSVVLRQDWREALAPLRAPVFAGLSMLGAVWLCRYAAAGGLPLVALLSLQIAVGALVYFAMLWIAALPLLLDTRELVLDLLRPQRTA